MSLHIKRRNLAPLETWDERGNGFRAILRQMLAKRIDLAQEMETGERIVWIQKELKGWQNALIWAQEMKNWQSASFEYNN